MEETFKIYIDRLGSGEKEILEEDLDPSFMEVQESGLKFVDPIRLEGEAYLSGDALILHFHLIETLATMLCNVCNKETKTKLTLKDIYITEDLDQIRSGIYQYKDLLRETLLVEVPSRVECNKDGCPERATLAKYLKKNKKDEEELFHPFADL